MKKSSRRPSRRPSRQPSTDEAIEESKCRVEKLLDMQAATQARHAEIDELNARVEACVAYLNRPDRVTLEDREIMRRASSIFARKQCLPTSVSSKQPHQDEFSLCIHDLRLFPSQLIKIGPFFSGKTECITFISDLSKDPSDFFKLDGCEHESFGMDVKDCLETVNVSEFHPDFLKRLKDLGELSENHAFNC
jgi:hypothetical protein